VLPRKQVGLGNHASALVGVGLVDGYIDGLLPQALDQTAADRKVLDQKRGVTKLAYAYHPGLNARSQGALETICQLTARLRHSTTAHLQLTEQPPFGSVDHPSVSVWVHSRPSYFLEPLWRRCRSGYARKYRAQFLVHP
jgi:hypothetical protein